MQRTERKMWVPLNDGTLQDLVAAHLGAIGILNDIDEVIKIEIGCPDKKGMRKISFMFIEEREAQVIVHK